MAGIQKVPAALEMVQELHDEQEPVVVAAHHKAVISGLKEGLADRGITSLVIDGSTPTRKRQKLADAFQDGEADVMIISQAGREGLDLTRSANFMLVEREWNPMSERQAADRIHRFGQDRPCTEQKLMLEGSVDQHMKAIYDGKASTIDAVIDGRGLEQGDEKDAPSGLEAVVASIKDAYLK